MVTGLGHIAITAQDIEASIDFYGRVLGLPEAFRMKKDDGSLWMVYFKTGSGDFIEVFDAAGEPEVPTPDGIAFKHYCLWVDDIDQTLKDLKARGLDVDVNGAKTGRSRCRQYFIADPDGIRIELMQLMPGSEQAKALATD